MIDMIMYRIVTWAALWTSAILMSALGASAAAASRTEMASASLFDGHEVASIVCDTRQNVPWVWPVIPRSPPY
jgi:hypothetical protein